MQRSLFLTLTEPVSQSNGWHLTLQFMLFYIVIQAPLQSEMPTVRLRNRLRHGEKKAVFSSKNGLFLVKNLVFYILTASKYSQPPRQPPRLLHAYLPC